MCAVPDLDSTAGGDLMTMLMKYDVFSEDVSRFYMAECILAIEAVHKLGYIHRYELFNSLNVFYSLINDTAISNLTIF